MILRHAIVPYHPKDRATVGATCRSLKEVLKVDKIFLVGSEDPCLPGARFLDERGIGGLVSLETIATKLQAAGSRFTGMAGWIHHQLLKLAACELVSDIAGDYLIADSDIVFLRSPYERVPNGSCPCAPARSGESHEPYRQHYLRLMGEPASAGFSFLNRHMVFNRDLLDSMKDFIEARSGMRWDLAILAALDCTVSSGFSEYDLYGNWVLGHFRERVLKVEMRIRDVAAVPREGELREARKSGEHILSLQARSRR